MRTICQIYLSEWIPTSIRTHKPATLATRIEVSRYALHPALLVVSRLHCNAKPTKLVGALLQAVAYHAYTAKRVVLGGAHLHKRIGDEHALPEHLDN